MMVWKQGKVCYGTLGTSKLQIQPSRT